MAEFDGRVDPHFVPVLAGAVAEQKVLPDVPFRRDLEVEDRREHAVGLLVVVLPLRVLLHQRLEHFPADHHEGSSHPLRTDQPHAVHGQLVVLVHVEIGDVHLLFRAHAGDASNDALLRVRSPSQQPEHVIRVEVDVGVDEEQVRGIRLKEVLHKQVPGARDNRAAADAADMHLNAMLRGTLNEPRERNGQLQGNLEVVGR